MNEARWDATNRKLRRDVEFEIGRRLTTSASNRVSPNTEVTPDCTVQTQQTWGFVAEIKLGLPKDASLWEENFTQLLKYDDNLVGWWTASQQIETHDIVGLVPIERAVRFADRLEAWQAEKDNEFQRKVSVIGFFKKSGVKDFMALMKQRGVLSNRDLDQRLREGRLIAFDILITEYEDRKFVDHMPPLPYLLQIMWDHLFTQYAADVQDEQAGVILLEVTVEKVAQDLQLYFGFKSRGHRSPGIPPPNWVIKALDVLVSSKVAKRSGEGKYLIEYKRTRVDTLRKFGQMCFKLSQKRRPQAPGGTPTLPGLG